MESGSPQEKEKYTSVDLGGFKVYVSLETVFSDDIPVILDFSRRNGKRDVGVPNVVF